MKNVIFGLLLLSGFSAIAAPEPILFEGVNIAPLVELYKPLVKVLTKPVKVYHYNQSGKNGDSPNLLSRAKKMGNSYWGSYGQSTANTMGYGLYFANDPVATESYGGGVGSFSLIQATFPKGLRILDLVSVGFYSKYGSNDQTSVASEFGCPQGDFSQLFVNGGSALPTNCQKLVKFIFRDVLKIQAFNYPYFQAIFHVCNPYANGFYPPAYVVTNADWMSTENIIFFNKNSGHAKEDRRIILSLFIEAKLNQGQAPSNRSSSPLPPSPTQALQNYIYAHPDEDLQSYKNNCDEKSCELIATFCDQEEVCKEVILVEKEKPMLPALKYEPRTITLEDLGPYSTGSNWKDLIGEKTSENLYEWLYQFRLGCDGTNPLELPEQK